MATLNRSTGKKLKGQTLSQVVSHAKTSVSQAKETGLMAKRAGFSSVSLTALACYDQVTQSWKTYQRSLFGGLIEFSERWPRSGMMLNGIAYRLRSLTQTMRGTGFSYMPSPRARDGKSHYVSTLATALKRSGPGAGHQGHWIHVYLSSTGLKKGWANPQFSEWMMGLPIGWTDLDVSETQLIHASQNE